MSFAAFRKIQAGQESTLGTEVAADKILVGNLLVTPRNTLYSPVDDRGSLAEFRRDIVVATGADLRYTGSATYQQLCDFLAMAYKGGVTGVVLEVATSWTWTHTPSLTATNAQDSYTVEFGDDANEHTIPGVMCRSLELSIALGDVLGLSADLFGWAANTNAFTASQVDPTVKEIVSSHLNVYIDTTWAGLGTTPMTDTVLGGTVRIPGVVPVKYADGTLNYSAFAEPRRHIEIELEMAMNALGYAQYTALAALTNRAIRLEWTGPTLGANTYKLTIDAIGRWVEDPEFFGEQDGMNVLRFRFRSRGVYESAAERESSIVVVNNIATI